MLDSLLGNGKKRKAEQLVAQGLVMLDNHNNQDALQAFRQAILLGQDNIAPHMKNLFSSFAQNHCHAEAIAIGKPLSTYYSQDAQLYNSLGNQYRHLRQIKESQFFYKYALKLNPKYPLPYLNLAALTAKVDRYDQAIEPLLTQFQDQNNFILPPYQGEQDLHTQITGAQKTAIPNILNQLHTTAQKALENITPDPNAPGHPSHHLANLVIASLQMEQLTDATKGLKDLKQNRGIYPYISLLTAILAAKQKQLDMAIKILRAEQAQTPDERYINLNLGVALRMAGKHHQASVYLIRTGYLLEKSYGLYSSDQIETKAQQCAQQNQYKKALGLYQILAKIDARPLAVLEMSKCLFFLKQLPKAIQIAEKGFADTVKVSTAIKNAYATQAKIFFETQADIADQNRTYEKALTLIEVALKYSKSSTLLKKAAHLANQAGDNKKAAQFIEKSNNNGFSQVELQEKKREKYIQLGKKCLHNKQFQSAIHNFELAFDIQPDKDLFVFLASIYKKLKQPRALSHLMKRWSLITGQAEK